MRKLYALLAPALFAATLAATVPAQASPTPNRSQAVRQQIDELKRDVNRNDNRDRVSEREAAGLRNEVRRLDDQFRAYNRNGLSNAEFRTLENRIHNIRGRLHNERRDPDHHRG